MDGTDVSLLPEELKRDKTKVEWIKDGKIAFENSLKSHNYNKQRFDKNRKQIDFSVSDMVYVENGNKLNRNKLDELKIGLFEIMEKISNSIYRINTGYRMLKSNLFHITKLLPM